LEHGATVHVNDLAHALDEDRLAHVRLLLEHGADPNEGAIVAHAVRRGRGPEFLRLLAQHGADLDRPGGETWRGDVPLRTPYQHAFLRGRSDQADTLAELGASTEIDPRDRAVAAVARGEQPETPLPDALDPDAQEVLVLAALRGHADLVLELVGPTFAGLSAGRPRERSCTTPPGSAAQGSSGYCSRAAPTGMRVRPRSSTHRSRGPPSHPSTTSCRDATTSPWPSSSPRRTARSSQGSSTSPTGRCATGWKAASLDGRRAPGRGVVGSWESA
jgi:hypothetical protein